MTASKSEFQRRLRDALDKSDCKSDRQASKMSGLSSGQIHSWLSPSTSSGKDHGPGAISLAKVCETIGADISHLLGIDSLGKPSFNDLIASWEIGDKSLSCLDHVSDHFDVYTLPKPTDKKLLLYRLGRKSLATKQTGIIARRFFQEAMNTFSNEKKRMQIIQGYSQMSNKEIDISIQTLHVPRISHLKEPINLRYQRLLLRVSGEDNENLVVNYSVPL